MQAGLPAAYLGYLQKQIGIESAVGATADQPSGERRSMLAGTTELIERTLKLSNGLKTKSVAQALSAAPARFDSLGLITDLYALIERNWDRSSGRSGELWRWEAQTKIGADNQSLEKTLEKAIVVETREWVNQIPAATGLLEGVEERHINVDLARRCGPGWFELVELKIGPNADTPVWAAFEILRYALLYCFARSHRSDLNLPKARTLMDAQQIDLKVLAPHHVYAGYRLAWLEESLDGGLQDFARQGFSGSLILRFQFETFPADFRWPDEDTARLRQMFASRSRMCQWT